MCFYKLKREVQAGLQQESEVLRAMKKEELKSELKDKHNKHSVARFLH